ncbi:MAG: GNAT family N-acetyltransferase [Pirellulaceae bacterium]
MKISSFRLEAMRPADHAAVLDLWNSCPGVRADESLAELTRIIERNPGLSAIALAPDESGSEQLAGAVLCCHDGRRGYLYHLAVRESQRGEGIARALVQRSLQQLAAAGIRRCTIFSIVGNESGEAFWRGLGWFERTELKAFAVDLTN